MFFKRVHMNFEAVFSSGWLGLDVIGQIWMGTWEAGVSLRRVNPAEFCGIVIDREPFEGGTCLA